MWWMVSTGHNTVFLKYKHLKLGTMYFIEAIYCWTATRSVRPITWHRSAVSNWLPLNWANRFVKSKVLPWWLITHVKQGYSTNLKDLSVSLTVKTKKTRIYFMLKKYAKHPWWEAKRKVKQLLSDPIVRVKAGKPHWVISLVNEQ